MEPAELRKAIKAAIGLRADDLAKGVRDDVHEWISKNGGSVKQAEDTSADVRQRINGAIDALIDGFDAYGG